MPLFTNEDLDTNVNGPGAAAVNIQDGGNSITVDGTVTTTPSGTQNVNLVSTITVPISAATLPLPAGAATAALQTQPGVDIGDVTVNNAAGAAAVNIQDGGNSITVDGTVAVSNPGLTDAQLRATPVPVSGTVTANAGTGTFAISAVSLPLPTGAATGALQTTGNASLAAIDAGIPAALGQTTMANSMPVVIASDQSAIPVTFTAPATTTLATVTSVAVSTTVATLSVSNSAKQKVVVFNEAGTLFVKLGSGATSASYSYRLTANTTLEIEGYAGIVTAIKQSGTSAALVTEVGI